MNKKLAELLTMFFNYIEDIIAGMTGTAKDLQLSIIAGGYGDYYGAKMIFDTLMPLALCLTIVYFIIECNKRWAIEGNDISVKSFGAPFFKLALAAGVLSALQNGGLMGSIVSGMNGLITIGEKSVPIPKIPDGTFDKIVDNLGKGAGFLLMALLIFCVTIGLILGIIIKFMFMYKVFCYRIEFYLRVGFTPVACADVYSGSNSQAMRWLKNCIGFALYGASILMIPKIVAHFAMTPLIKELVAISEATENISVSQIFESMAFMMLIPVISLGMINTAKQVTKEVAG